MSKHELLEELAEITEREQKANAAETLCTLLNNALCYMEEQGMSKEEIADYIGSSVDELDAIDNEDFENIGR